MLSKTSLKASLKGVAAPSSVVQHPRLQPRRHADRSEEWIEFFPDKSKGAFISEGIIITTPLALYSHMEIK